MPGTTEIKNRYQSGERNFSNCECSSVNLSFLTLDGADFTAADLSHANLSGALLKNCNFSAANLSFANLSGANLKKAILLGSNLEGAILSTASLTDANYNSSTILPQGVDLQLLGAVNLDDSPPELNIEQSEQFSAELEDSAELETKAQPDNLRKIFQQRLAANDQERIYTDHNPIHPADNPDQSRSVDLLEVDDQDLLELDLRTTRHELDDFKKLLGPQILLIGKSEINSKKALIEKEITDDFLNLEQKYSKVLRNKKKSCACKF